jgi:hypothetical protein
VSTALIWLDHLARQTDSPRPVARTLGIALAGGLMVSDFALVPVICAAMVGGLASAWLLLTKLTD